MNIKKIAANLVKLSPRFAKGEEQTARFIKKFLQENNISFVDQEYVITIPVPKEAELLVDGKAIPCRNVGSESGTFSSKNDLVSSLYWGDNDFYLPKNINFNPQCKGSVSMALFYKHPALAIRANDVGTIINAKQISGKTVVEPYSFTGHNFLVGNCVNPKNIIFTHYDCWESGAIDNASGTAVLLYLVKNSPEILKNSLFVIAGHEEVSYDEPIYWGKGYREFEKDYKKVLSKSKKIICVDCVGYSENDIVTDREFIQLALPLKDAEKYKNMILVTGSFEKLMEVYHSNDDSIDLLTEEQLLDAVEKISASL